MMHCDTCRERMLEALYGLLENDEPSAWDAHLLTCASCQAELARAKAQQQLLAAAAKMEFVGVQFAAPMTDNVTPREVVLFQRPRQPRQPLRWRRFAVAAAVLLGLGCAAATLWYGRDYGRVEEIAKSGQRRIEDLRTERYDVQTQLARLPKEKNERLESLRKEQRNEQLQVKVLGPAVLRPGAVNEYRLQASTLNGQPADAEIKAEVQENGQTIAKQIKADQIAPGLYNFKLSADLTARPSNQANLVMSARRANGSRVELNEPMQVSPPVYVTHLEIDKPIYQLGETLHFRSLTLDRASLKPANEDLNLQYVLTLPGPGSPPRVVAQGRSRLYEEGPTGRRDLLGPDGKPLRGLGAGSVRLEDGWPGGEYALIVREINQRFPEQRRKFLVNKYEKPKLNKELDFSRKTYGPGEEVAARCKAHHLDGRPLKNCPVLVVVRVDGKQFDQSGAEKVESIRFQTDDAGNVNVRFRLPNAIERGLASVAVQFADPAMPDTIVRPIPIVLNKLDIDFFPEGGDLVAGLRSRVYLQVRSTLGKPADLKGQLLEDGKPLGVAVETLTSAKTPELNQGMGRFEFTPRAGHKYALKVESPAGVTKLHELPEIKPEGVVVSLPQGVIAAGRDIPVTVRSSTKRTLIVSAYCRGQLLDTTELSAIHFVGDEASAVLHPSSGAGGACRVTVFEVLIGEGGRNALRPVAERLFYRQPTERVQLALKPNQQSYVPRQAVKLDVEAKTEKGEPTPAVVLLRVIDKSVKTLADDKTLRTMPTHFLLTTDVREPEDLEYADFLLGTHSQAPEALDLLLGTQGWRRFADSDPNKLRDQPREEFERVIVRNGQSQPPPRTAEELQRIESEYKRRSEDLTARAAQVRAAEDKAREDHDYRAAVVALKGYDQFLNRGRMVLGVVLGLMALVCLLLGLFRKLLRAVPYYAGAIGCAAGVLLLATLSWQVTPPSSPDELRMAQGFAAPKSETQPAPAAPENRAEKDSKGEAVRGLGMKQEKAEGLVPPPPRAALEMGNGAGFAGGGAPGAIGGGMMGMEGNMKPGAGGGMAGFGGGRGVPNGMMGIGGGMMGMVGGGQLPRGAAGQGKDAAQMAQFGAQALRKDGKADFALQNANVEQDRLQKQAELAHKGIFQQGGKGQGGANGPAAMPPAMMMPMAKRAIRPMASRPAPLPDLPVRVFAHVRADGPAELRHDFAETLFWHPVLVLPGGKAEVAFDLCDSLGAFEVTAYAHTLDGRLGAATSTLTSQLPFTVQPRTPLEVTAGDKIDIPLAIANNTSQPRDAHVTLDEHGNLSMNAASSAKVNVPANSALRKLYRVQPIVQEGVASLAFTGKADGFPADSVRADFRIVPEGFPIVASRSDLLEKSATNDVTLPSTWIKGTLKCQVQVYPSTLADLQNGLEAMLREPGGCFEQTSTSNYPNVLILQYLKESNQTKPEVERRAREMLERGYQRLVSFECEEPTRKKREGYEWFGGAAAPHEALTAYGLMQFRDMARFQTIDPAMLRRTRTYLLSQRDGQGGFQRNPRALDTFGRAPQHVTNAYIVWALTESGKDDDVSKELTTLQEQAKTSKDPYFLSLVANSLINRAKTADAVALLKKAAEGQKADGHLDAEQTSITGSGGRDLQIETTALAVLGWLKANPGEFNGNVQKAIRWIGQQRGGFGGFGSTQSTILALKALILYTKANKKTPESGELRLFIGDKQIAKQPFAAGVTEPLTLSVPNAETMLNPGKNSVRVEISGNNAFPYTLTWSYQTRQPASAANCPVRLSAKLDRDEIREGQTVRVNVRVENASDKGQGMAVAILGLPGGLTIPEDVKQLKDYARSPADGQRPLVSAFEIRGRELVLYWRDLAPDQKIDVPIDLIGRVPGEYSGPASRAYLYYNADAKHWIEPLHVRIAAKAE